MNLLLNHDLFRFYFENCVPKTKKDFELKIDSLFSKVENNILLSRCFVELLEEEFSKNNTKHFEAFKLFVENLYLSNRFVSVETNGNSSDLEVEFLNILSKENLNVLIVLSMKNSINFNKHKKKGKIKIVDNIANNLDDKINFLMASNHYIKVRYYDFSSKAQIEDFFKYIFSIPKKISELIIFDRLTNLNHSFYNHVTKRKILVKYYTYGCTTNSINAIKTCFGVPFEVWNTNNRDNIHERNMFFENFIIETNEDPSNIDSNRDTWNLSVQYSKEDYKKSLVKVNKFFLKERLSI